MVLRLTLVELLVRGEAKLLSPKLLLWAVLATGFFALALYSAVHYCRFRDAVEKLNYRGIKTTKEFREFCDALDRKTKTGLQAQLLASMIPIEIAAFVLAAISAVLELL
jgi:hypothetical protein